jgi:hypothetical protein
VEQIAERINQKYRDRDAHVSIRDGAERVEWITIPTGGVGVYFDHNAREMIIYHNGEPVGEAISFDASADVVTSAIDRVLAA